MNGSIKEAIKVMLVVAVVAGGALSEAADVWAQDKGASLAQQIQGTWLLVSMYNEQSGKKIDQFGPNPKGSMIFTPDGHFANIIIRANLPQFAANNRMKGTVEENQAVVQGSVAFFGTYAVASEKEHTVILHIYGCTFPNWDGEDQTRIITVIGDELKRTNPTTTIGGTNYSVWKRVK